MSHEPYTGLKIAIIGGCQVTGLAASARHLLPGANISYWHVGVFPPDTPEEIFSKLILQDLVISQLSDEHNPASLGVSRLREKGVPVRFLPVVVFNGFHPDCSYAMDGKGLTPGWQADYHSLIVSASFLLGRNERQTASLFNDYVFSEFGYFEAYGTAVAAFEHTFSNSGYDVDGLIQRLAPAVGPCMHTINHPHISLLAFLSHQAIVQAGFISMEVPVPENIDDYLATHFTWPLYPALGKKIGLDGSLTFLLNSHGLADEKSREISLMAYIENSFQIYQHLDRTRLNIGRAAEYCERLKAILS